MNCGVDHRCGLDPTLLWLWRTLAAVALIRPLAWEPPYAKGAASKDQNKIKIKEIRMPSNVIITSSLYLSIINCL